MMKEILIGGLGWISAGAILLASGMLLQDGGIRVFDGIMIMLAGLGILIMNKRIERIRARMIAKSRANSG